MKIRYLLYIIGILLSIVFLDQNGREVPVKFILGESIEIQLWLVMLTCIFTGVMLTVMSQYFFRKSVPKKA